MSATIATPHPSAVKNPLQELGKYGQSVSLAFMRRGLFTSGELQHTMDEDGLRGVTDNSEALQELQAACDERVGLPVLGQKFTLGVVKAARARGDFLIAGGAQPAGLASSFE